MTLTDQLDRIESEAKVNAVLGQTASQPNARQTLTLVAAIRAVLDLPTSRVWGPSSMPEEIVKVDDVRAAIESALGGAR